MDDRRTPGMPIYLDPIDRALPDPACTGDTDWHPSTPPTRILWTCYESLQKVKFSLKVVGASPSERERNRFLIGFAVPLHDFLVCLPDLSRSIEGDRQTRASLSTEELVFLREQRKRYLESVIEQSNPIRVARNKLGAHTDKRLDPGDAAKLVAGLDVKLVGPLLHAALLVFRDLARLNCFAWSSRGYREDETRLMVCEPYVLNFKTEELGDLVGIEQTESPKRHIFDLIADVVELSTWMFDEHQTRLVVSKS